MFKHSNVLYILSASTFSVTFLQPLCPKWYFYNNAISLESTLITWSPLDIPALFLIAINVKNCGYRPNVCFCNFKGFLYDLPRRHHFHQKDYLKYHRIFVSGVLILYSENLVSMLNAHKRPSSVFWIPGNKPPLFFASAPGGTRIDDGDKNKVTAHCVFTASEDHSTLRSYAQVRQ